MQHINLKLQEQYIIIREHLINLGASSRNDFQFHFEKLHALCFLDEELITDEVLSDLLIEIGFEIEAFSSEMGLLKSWSNEIYKEFSDKISICVSRLDRVYHDQTGNQIYEWL